MSTFEVPPETTLNQRIAEMAARGMADRAIARELGCSLGTVQGRRRRAGIASSWVQPVQTHGGGAYERGCRCDVCRRANADHHLRWSRGALGRLEATQIPHGLAGYRNYRCRCKVCLTAGAEGNRALWARVRAGLVEHVRGGALSGCPCENCRRKSGERTKASVERWQRETLASASRYGYEWTGPELETAARAELTAREVAALIGRTLHAVTTMRRKIRADPRKARLAGLSTLVADKARP